MSKITRLDPALTMEELMVLLSENIRRLRADEVSPARANALATSAGMIFRGVKLQLEYARLTNRKPNIPLLNAGQGSPKA